MAGVKEKEVAIHRAAIQVISENGFHGAKMARIAEVAGVSAGSLYTYYADKNDILDRIFETLWKDQLSSLVPLAKRGDMPPEEKLGAALDIIFDTLTSDENLVVVFATEFNTFISRSDASFARYYGSCIEALVAIVEEGMAKGVFNPHIPSTVMVNFFLGGIRKTLHEQVVNPISGGWAPIRTHLKALMRRGVMA